MKRGLSSQKRAKKDLLASLDTALRIYMPAREMCKFDYDSFEMTAYHPNVAAKIIGLSFLSALAAWEDFISQVYLGYLCGYPSPNGSSPELRAGKCQDKSHALLLAAGEPSYRDAERRMRWGNLRWVKSLATVHLKSGNPFSRINESDLRWLDLGITIRNRVAHNSEKSKSSFKDSINRLFAEPKNSPLPPGFSPGQFLIIMTDPYPELRTLSSDDHHWGDVFEGYISLFQRLAEEICPG